MNKISLNDLLLHPILDLLSVIKALAMEKILSDGALEAGIAKIRQLNLYNSVN